jgi:hypothetical protein
MYIRIYFGGLGGGVWISDIHTFGAEMTSDISFGSVVIFLKVFL